MLTLVSLFDGIGGFPLAFGRAGARTVATVEIDKAAAAVSARHFPDAKQFPDVTKVTGDELRAAGFVPERGIVTAGWPCQDFSVAGRRAGLAGARSGLWWEVVRILADLRPKWFVGENVPGILSSVCQCPGDGMCGLNGWDGECTWDAAHDVPGGCCRGGCMETHGGAMGSVLGSLAELGYGVAYRILDAQHFGVPQQRRRVFIVGHLGAPFGAAAQVLLEPESSAGDSAAGGEAREDVTGLAVVGVGAAGRDVAPAVTARYGKGAESAADDALLLDGIEHTHTHTHNGSSVDAAGRRQTGLPDRRRVSSGRPPHRREVVSAMTTSYCGGIGGVDDNAAQAGYVVVQPTTMTGGVTHTLTSEGADASEDGTGRGTPIVVHDAYQCHGSNVGPMGTLRQGNGALTGGVPFVVQPLALRGREGGAMLEVGDAGDPAHALRTNGGGASLPIVSIDMRNAARASGTGAGTQGDGIREGGPSYAVTALERNLPAVADETVVRRLTELECERLQGYPDQYTDDQSGSARYRQLGNSVAVPVVEWLARRIIAVDEGLA